MLADGMAANLAQIEAGLAWHYREYAREQPAGDRTRYSEAEQSARAREQGLWRDPLPMPPWAYRNAGR